MISRKYYTKAIGIPEQPGGQRLFSVFSEYEKLYNVETNPKALLPEMRIWLEAAFRDRSLAMHAEGLDRR
ncbi:hypothetical protein [Phreatobacter cathodiphilus]|uniref:hypothetical protein n=1 Tax=Phreatobacter cathodiphilus TaxID=1868589 RepID=UPI0011B21C4A|nr:hypothetical protein [Phreatobacter cathodiphilus]